MNKDKYVKAVTRKIKCSHKKKAEICRELEADIQTAFENGEQWQQIKDRMGAPSSLAMEFNENFSETELNSYKKTKKVKIALVIVLILGLSVTGIYLLLPKTFALDDSNIFDKKAVISQAETIIDLLNSNDYETIKNQYAATKMAKALNAATIDDAKKQIGSDWGAFQSFTSIYTAETKQMGNQFAVVQITALYEIRSVTYTISFDEDMKLVGLFMK